MKLGIEEAYEKLPEAYWKLLTGTLVIFGILYRNGKKDLDTIIEMNENLLSLRSKQIKVVGFIVDMNVKQLV